MVGAGEAAATGEALEGFGSCVLPIVPGQLVGAGKAPVAAFPRALVGLLTCQEELQVTGMAKPSLPNTHLILCQTPTDSENGLEGILKIT